MADVFNIAGEINSTSQEGTAVHANQVKDDLKNKKQAQINEEVGEELALHTNRLNALTGQNYVTVVATQITTAADIPTLINASGEGEQTDTLYRVGFWDGSAYVADKYTEYAWNGTAYVILDVKSSIGEVFDISQYNAVGGTLTPYVDLEAALGTSGANVPSSVRRGGMSIKFVQSSDNKYVQYRLMSDDWSVNTSDWSFCGDDALVENPEWVKVYINKKGGIYFGIKSDGSIEWSVGIPTPIRKYVKDKIAEIMNGSDSTSIDGITKIIEFLDSFTTSDTLKNLLDNIEERVPDVVNNNEWVKVYVNQVGGLYSGIKEDGSYHFFGDVYINNQNLTDVVKDVVSRCMIKELSISIPSIVYLRTQQEFSIWYRNVIFNSFAFSAGNYSIRCKKKSGNNYSNIGTDSTYEKFNYVSASETEFDLEIRIYDTYTDNIVFSKVVHFVVKNPENIVNKQPKIVLIGDSFTDGHYVCRWTYQFLTDDGFTPQSVGVNRGWPADGWTDDAWSGKGIEWFHDDATGYLRDDRPLEDAIWDAGWGENEEHGWTSGQTYSDLTAEQKAHGHTKNEFYNPSIKKFDFSYYMSNYHSSIDSIDCVVFNIGLNDVIWNYKTDRELLRLIERLDDMINSVHDFDADANIILCQVTPQPEHDDYTSTAGEWITSPRVKYWQERWNRMLIEHFDTASYRTNKVFIAPTAANFDTENAIKTTTIHPDKFDSNITQIIISDIHPNIIGSKFISDTIVDTIEGVLI